MVDGILRQYGTEMILRHDGTEETVRGFLQPDRSKNWQSVVNASTALGEMPRHQYVYIGPAGAAVAEGDVLTLDKKNYIFHRAELYYYGNEPVYTWGLCIEKGVNDTWGTES